MSAADKIKVVLLENDGNDAMLVMRELRGVAIVDVAVNGVEFRKLLNEKTDVVVVDLALPDITGQEAIRLSRGLHPFTPVIILTGSVGPREADLACDAGASRFFLKDSLIGLPRAITQAHRQSRQAEELDRQAKEVERLKAQAMRNQRHEAVGALTSAICHDINNTLSSVVMGIGLLRGRVNPSDVHIVDSMWNAANKGAGLVQQMMTFSKGSNGVALKNVTPDTLLGEVGNMIRYKASASNVQLSVRTEVGTSNIKCDSTQINTLLVNMAINAIYAMQPGGGKLSIEAQNKTLQQPAGDYVCISVRDSGPGIPEDIIDKVWEPYFTTKGSEGTGLGLAMVKPILEAHGGFVAVETGSNGTTFNIYLPIFVQEAERPKIEFKGNGEVIVLVDDEEGLRCLMTEMLEQANYKVLSACNGPEALNFFRSAEKVDLLISDLALPIFCGRELVRNLHAQGFHPITIFITGREFEEPIEPEPAAMIFKPFTKDQLLEAIQRVLAPA